MKLNNLKSYYPILSKIGLSAHTSKTYTTNIATDKKWRISDHLFSSETKRPPAWMAICFFVTGILLAIFILH